MHRAAFERAALGAAALFSSWLIGSAPADAQDIETQILAFEGRTSVPNLDDLASTNSPQRINQSDCGNSITFRFRNVDSSRAELQFFEGGSCDDVAERNDETSTVCEPLDARPVAIEGRLQVDVDIPVGDLVPCEEGGSGDREVWVLAVNNETSEVTGVGQKDTFPLAFDLTPAGAVGDLSATPGEASFTLEWEMAGATDEYEIFIDPTGCEDGVVTSPGFLADPPTTGGMVEASAGPGATETTVEYPAGVMIGQEMAVAIRSVDDAGNEGELSEPICVERIETTSWWDTYCGTGSTAGDGGAPPASGREVCTNGGCAVSPGAGGSAALMAMLGLALAAFVARRRNR